MIDKHNLKEKKKKSQKLTMREFKVAHFTTAPFTPWDVLQT